LPVCQAGRLVCPARSVQCDETGNKCPMLKFRQFQLSSLKYAMLLTVQVKSLWQRCGMLWSAWDADRGPSARPPKIEIKSPVQASNCLPDDNTTVDHSRPWLKQGVQLNQTSRKVPVDSMRQVLSSVARNNGKPTLKGWSGGQTIDSGGPVVML
jgi:hypothetical protein